VTKSVIIIGAGFAGMSAAAFMAKEGWKVTVLEKCATAGGRARQLQAEGFTFDMGPSWYWMPDVFDRFFAQFDKQTHDYYSLSRLDPSYRVYWKNELSDLPAEYAALRQFFETVEQGSGERLDKYLEEAERKYRIGMQRLVYKPGQSFTEFLDPEVIRNIFTLDVFSSIKKHVKKYFKNWKLQQLMEFPVLFLGALPEHTPALYSLMNYADMKGGTWYPQGGMYSVVKGIKKLAEDLGVSFRFDEEVEQIVIEKTQVRRVRSRKNEYAADVVISGADYHHTEQNLLNEEQRSYSDSYWNKKVLAPSCLIYFLGLNKKLKDVLHHSLFFDAPFDQHADQIYKNQQWPDEPLFYLSVTSVTDKSVAPAGCENLFILIPVASGLTGDTVELRDKYFLKVIQRIEKHTGQSIQDSIIYKKTYSVSDFINDYHSFKGNAYGLANTLSQTANLKPSCRSKKIDNLFYTGQFTVPGPGVPPCLISGEVVANEVIKSFNR
jgi:phytoene desaturase